MLGASAPVLGPFMSQVHQILQQAIVAMSAAAMNQQTPSGVAVPPTA